MWKLAKSDYLKLVLILGLAFYVAFIPHHGYSYPVHVDEWAHLAFSEVIVQEASAIEIHSPFTGKAAAWSQSLEAGFHLLWAILKQVTDISWMVLFKYSPAVIFMITVLLVYILGRREGFGWEAALCTCFVPTTLRFMGPGFMVPVALGLLFIPLSLFIAFNFRNCQSYMLLFISTSFLVLAHGYTALGLIIALTPYIMLNLRKNFWHSLGITLALVVPFLMPLLLGWFLWGRNVLLSGLGAFITPQLPPRPELPYISQVPHVYGYLPTFLFVAGIFLLAMRGRLKDYSLVIAPMLFLVLIGSFVKFQYGIQTMYDRSFLYLMLMMGVVGGYGLRGIRDIRLSGRLKSAFLSRNTGNIICLILLIPTVFFSVRSHLDTPYYHMIDTRDYEAFVWIRKNTGDEYDKAILDPWKGTAFTAISGKKVYSRIGAAPRKSDMRAYRFLQEGCSDTAFLKQNGISIVYTVWECNNPDLVEVKKNVYLLEEMKTQ